MDRSPLYFKLQGGGWFVEYRTFFGISKAGKRRLIDIGKT
jgi:hypothetical protein